MRKLSRGLVLLVTVLLIGSSGLADNTYQGFKIVNVIVNGQPLQSDVPAVNLNGRTVLPLRSVADLAGMHVAWDPDSNTATLASQFTLARYNELQADNRLLMNRTTDLQKDKDRLTAEIETTKKDLAAARSEVRRLTAINTPAQPAPPPATGTPTTPPLKTAKEVQDYLQADYGTVDTAAGPLKLKYSISGPNDYNWVPHDYWVMIDWEPFLFFDNLEERISVTTDMKTATITKLKDHAKLVYDLASKSLPGKKLHGNYYTSWYKYPTIREGLTVRRYLSWQNYDGDALTSYADAKLSTFRFNPYIDTVKY